MPPITGARRFDARGIDQRSDTLGWDSQVLVICNGMPRSASTWSFNVALELLRGSPPHGEVHSGYAGSVEHFLESAPPNVAHIVVKCHDLDEYGRASTRSGDAKTIYTWRDPADAVVSHMRAFTDDFATSFAAVGSSLALYQFHRRCGRSLILDYDAIVAAHHEAVRRVAAFLGLDADPALVRAVAEATSIDRMRERAAPLTEAARSAGLSAFEYFDPETLLHPGHVRDGRSGHGMKALTPEQADRIRDLLREHGVTDRQRSGS